MEISIGRVFLLGREDGTPLGFVGRPGFQESSRGGEGGLKWLPHTLVLDDSGLVLTDSSGERRSIAWGNVVELHWTEPLVSQDGSRTWMLELLTQVGMVRLGIPEGAVAQGEVSRLHQWIEWFRAQASLVVAAPRAVTQPASDGMVVGQPAVTQPASDGMVVGQPAAPTMTPPKGRRPGFKLALPWICLTSGAPTWEVVGVAALVLVVLAGGLVGIFLASSGSGHVHRLEGGSSHVVKKQQTKISNAHKSQSHAGSKSSQTRNLPKLSTTQIDSLIASINITAADLPGWRLCSTSCGTSKGSITEGLGSSFTDRLASCMGIPAAKFKEVFQVSGPGWQTGESPTFTTGPSGTGLAQVQSAVGIARTTSTLTSGMSSLDRSQLPRCFQQAEVEKLQGSLPLGWSARAPFPATLVPAPSMPAARGFEVEAPVSLSEQVGSGKETLIVEYVQVAYLAIGRVEVALYSMTPDVELPQFQSLVEKMEQRSVAAWEDLKSGHVPARSPTTSSMPEQTGDSVAMSAMVA